MQPAIAMFIEGKAGLVGIGAIPIADGDIGAADNDFADVARLDIIEVVIDDTNTGV